MGFEFFDHHVADLACAALAMAAAAHDDREANTEVLGISYTGV